MLSTACGSEQIQGMFISMFSNKTTKFFCLCSSFRPLRLVESKSKHADKYGS